MFIFIENILHSGNAGTGFTSAFIKKIVRVIST